MRQKHADDLAEKVKRKSGKVDINKTGILTLDCDPVELSLTREELIEIAKSIKGTPYFWGGRYTQVGVNPEWTKMKKVTASGSRTSGQEIAYGLDCSGFVDWVYAQALLPKGYRLKSSGGTYSQQPSMRSVSTDELKPGDAAFTKNLDHVGIYIGTNDEGEKLYIHSAGSRPEGGFAGGIVKISTYKNFVDYRRPNVIFRGE